MKDRIGKQIHLGVYEGAIHPEYDDRAFIDAIKDCGSLLDRPSARILLDTRNRVGIVSLPRSSGKTEDVVVKEFRPRGVDRLKTLFLPSKAKRSWLGALGLIRKGLSTPKPIAFLDKNAGFFKNRSYFLAAEVKNVIEVRYLFRRLSGDDLFCLLDSLARHLSRCHERGVLHRDLSDGNILVRQSFDDKFEFLLVDTNRVRFKKRIGRFVRFKNLIRLGIPAESRRFFLERYLGTKPLKKSMWIWYKMNKGCFTGYIRMKKTLRLKKIARKLRIQ